MRAITNKQEKYIINLIKKDRSIKTVDDLKEEDWVAIGEMNYSEVLWANVNGFISDMRFKLLNN